MGREALFGFGSTSNCHSFFVPWSDYPIVGWPVHGNRFDGRRELDSVPAQHVPHSAVPQSGHSTFSAAGAFILSDWTGSDTFGASVTFAPGSSFIEPGLTPATSIALVWPTFTDASNQAGISRRYGGIHFKADDLTGRAVGKKIGNQAWLKAQSYFNGKAH